MYFLPNRFSQYYDATKRKSFFPQYKNQSTYFDPDRNTTKLFIFMYVVYVYNPTFFTSRLIATTETTLNYFHQVTSELGEKEEGNLEVESAKKSEKK